MASGFPSQGLSGSEYAGIGARIGAHIIDHLLVFAGILPGMILYIIGTVGLVGTANSSNSSSDGAGAAGGIAIVVIFLGFGLMFIGGLGVGLYNIFLLGRDGATLGKRWMHIKVLDPAGQPLGFGKAFLRELVKGAIGGACIILLFWPAWDPEQQGLQDKIFSTHVYTA